MMYNSHRRPQDDLPYEQRMKHIIQGYRYLWDKIERLIPYTKSLEEKVSELSDTLATKNQKNKRIHDELIEKRREVKRLKAHIDWLNEQSLKDG